MKKKLWCNIVGCHVVLAASAACVSDGLLHGHLQEFEGVARAACWDAAGLLTTAIEWQERKNEIWIATMREEGYDTLFAETGETLDSIHDPWGDLSVARSFAPLLPTPSHVEAHVLPVKSDGENQFYTGWVDLYFSADLPEGPRFLQLQAVWLTSLSVWDDAPTHYFFLQGPMTQRRPRQLETLESVCSKITAKLVLP